MVTPPPPPPVTEGRRLGTGFWMLWAAFLVANLGTGIGSVAFPWLATSLTREPLLIALIGVAADLPWLLLSLPVGAIVDRADHRRVLTVTHWGRAVLVGAVAAALYTGRMSLAVLYVVAFVLGALTVANENAAQTILPRLVGRSLLQRANARLTVADTTAGVFVGPWVGGLLVGVALAVPFTVDAALFMISGLLVLALPASRPERPEGPRSMRRELAEGLRFFWNHRPLRALGLLLSALNLAGAVAIATQVLFAQEVLGLSAVQYGLLFMVGAVGGTIGAQGTPWLEARLGPRRVLLLSLLGSALALTVVGLTSSGIAVALALAVSAGLGLAWNIITISYRQRIVPERLLGRVNSIYRLISWGPLPLGSAAGGLLVTAGEAVGGREFGLRTPVLLAAVAIAALFVIAFTRLDTGLWSRTGSVDDADDGG
ncbi:MFS transporter [Planomonospora sp. ID67723]|uniref:MFS transporter n=1 Tax=Planomonospora sp. ID67723 TaxID=2738134 RepID=UPI0018C3FB2B|nr:MFS transporter [Planomonospora sp. ID67723]MBG0832642.1 MFS transporter [Planomonospora sp. ID67723]